jgi:hypothetical protein
MLPNGRSRLKQGKPNDRIGSRQRLLRFLARADFLWILLTA